MASSVRVVLLRVGIDTGAGGINGPLFADGTFELIPIPDGHDLDPRTYGNTVGRHGRALIDYFPPSRRPALSARAMHVDPEFETFTYGDPTPTKRGLRHLTPGDLLVFYAGLAGWPTPLADPALYVIGYFEVERAGLAAEFCPDDLDTMFGANAHVCHPSIFADQKDRLVLVKGSSRSRLLTRATLISERGDRTGRPLKVISTDMRAVFGDFDGRVSLQRSPPRWVDPEYSERAARFVRSLS